VSGPRPRGEGRQFSREMTVARIRERNDAAVEVMFLESVRIYKLYRQHPAFDRILRLLRDTLEARRALTVTLASVDSDVIEGAEGS